MKLPPSHLENAQLELIQHKVLKGNVYLSHLFATDIYFCTCDRNNFDIYQNWNLLEVAMGWENTWYFVRFSPEMLMDTPEVIAYYLESWFKRMIGYPGLKLM